MTIHDMADGVLLPFAELGVVSSRARPQQLQGTVAVVHHLGTERSSGLMFALTAILLRCPCYRPGFLGIGARELEYSEYMSEMSS